MSNAIFFVALRENSAMLTQNPDLSPKLHFILDSGATEHLIQDKLLPYVTKLEELNQEIKIKVANGETLLSKQRALIHLTTTTGIKIKLNALVVANLSHNLLSVKRINELGKKVIFSRDKVLIVDNGFRMNCRLSNNLYIAEFTKTVETECSLTETDLGNLWHRRLGHLNRRSLKQLNLPCSKEICGPCMEGKATRLPFVSTTKPRTHRIGKLLHSDVGGPVDPPSINNERYYQVIIDDYSHFCVVYLMKTKAKVTENLINFIRQLEAEHNTKVSKIRCDNGGEYRTNKLKTFCQDKAIVVQYSMQYTPQMNGLSERFNRTLQNKVRTILTETSLPKNLWGEAIRCAAYQINRSPTSTLSGRTPSEIYLKKLDLKQLRVFEARAWAYKLPKGGKFDSRGREARMIGYSPSGYRL